jgi:hypothetical protein
MKLLGDGRTSDHASAFDDPHLQPRAPEIGGAGQAVVTGADHHHVHVLAAQTGPPLSSVAIGHVAAPGPHAAGWRIWSAVRLTRDRAGTRRSGHGYGSMSSETPCIFASRPSLYTGAPWWPRLTGIESQLDHGVTEVRIRPSPGTLPLLSGTSAAERRATPAAGLDADSACRSMSPGPAKASDHRRESARPQSSFGRTHR